MTLLHTRKIRIPDAGKNLLISSFEDKLNTCLVQRQCVEVTDSKEERKHAPRRGIQVSSAADEGSFGENAAAIFNSADTVNQKVSQEKLVERNR
ncbi:hypothetical protein TNCV_3848261 [Trichonephila clavipes]|uniref:Uncharacterized protein n=1 Tax=Trichonephila clavipes TaxID=2585209 RepID=A0A8X6R8A6_TRICX|nr:hypothetical protein TNCV_3848261 [Trichonephila clavipes]